MTPITYSINASVSKDELNELFSAAWGSPFDTNLQNKHRYSLLYVCAYADDSLVGYINVAWDGGIHAFLLDTSVHPEYQHQGIGTQLVREAVDATKAHDIEWLHVDFEPHLTDFYRACGFIHTEAGLMNLK
jgi:ribosomal protein S18 acetylase RimI-like enzyme